MKRTRIDRPFGKCGNTILISNKTAIARISVESLKVMVDPTFDEPLKDLVCQK